jgi:hypothetical protein
MEFGLIPMWQAMGVVAKTVAIILIFSLKDSCFSLELRANQKRLLPVLQIFLKTEKSKTH